MSHCSRRGRDIVKTKTEFRLLQMFWEGGTGKGMGHEEIRKQVLDCEIQSFYTIVGLSASWRSNTQAGLDRSLYPPASSLLAHSLIQPRPQGEHASTGDASGKR